MIIVVARKFEEIDLNKIMWGENIYPHDYSEDENEIHIGLKSRPHVVRCPVCGHETRTVNGACTRKVQDIPRNGKPVWLDITAGVYRCENEECKVRTFNEPLPFVHAQQRRTDQLNCLILAVAILTSNEGAGQILKLLGAQVSNDSVQRLLDRIEIPDIPDIEEIGVDDVAIRKGQTYATIILTPGRQLLALLPGRCAEALKAWLKEHPKVTRVARDRASAYAKAISEALPECEQVADRFHLFENIIKHLRDRFKEDFPCKIWVQDGELIEPDTAQIEKAQWTEVEKDTRDLSYDNTPPTDADGKPIVVDPSRRGPSKKSEQNRKKKRELIENIRADHGIGMNFTELSNKYGPAVSTVSRYCRMTEDEIDSLINQKRQVNRQLKGEGYFNIIHKMMADDHDCATILSYLRSQGVDDSLNLISTYMTNIQTNHFPERKRIALKDLVRRRSRKELQASGGPTFYTRGEVLRELLIVNPKTKHDEQLQALMPAIEEKYPVAAEVRAIFTDYHSIIMGDDPDALDGFIGAHRNDFLAGFCERLEQDSESVKNAIRYDTNSGYVEGCNCKFKNGKRDGYGRNDIPSLEKRAYLWFAYNKPGFDIKTIIDYSKPGRLLKAA